MEDVETSVREHSFTIHGEPASKANSRKIVLFGKRPALIKSEKARAYVKQFEAQCEVLDDLFVGDVGVEMTIYYCTRRPDLDESVILDCMETYIYKNDRQVKEKIIRHGLDKENPRAVIRVYEL
jgi:Holliday junction resolvase RusA-like endonuclease|tara:strand:- start:239 stop:610 length:372 start_codon:yes stop_codon:yes gene_type:complete